MKFSKDAGFSQLLVMCFLTLGLFMSSCSKKDVIEDEEYTGEDVLLDEPLEGEGIDGVNLEGESFGEESFDGVTEAAPLDESAMQFGQALPELSSVRFDYDSFSLNSQARNDLEAHAAWLQSNPSVAIQIEGHCDERGTEEYNLALGERRAAAVKDYLVYQKGVSENQVSTISYGEERPVDPSPNDGAWSQNRRVEFVTGTTN